MTRLFAHLDIAIYLSAFIILALAALLRRYMTTMCMHHICMRLSKQDFGFKEEKIHLQVIRWYCTRGPQCHERINVTHKVEFQNLFSFIKPVALSVLDSVTHFY